MADNAEKLDIKIATQYDGAGAQAARTDVEATGTVVEKQASVFERLAKERAENDARMNAATTEETAAQAKLTIEQEKQLVVATRRAMIEAAIAGDQTELSKLRSELAVRQLTIQTLQTEQMAQEQINVLLVEQDALIKEAAASVAAKAAAEEAEAAAAADQTTVYGPRNRNLRLLKNFGVDGNTIASMSIVVLLTTELYRIGEGLYQAEEKRREELEKETKEFQEQTHHLEDQIGTARTVNEMTSARREAEAEINKLKEQRASADDNEKALIDARIGILEGEAAATYNLSDAASQRKTLEESVKATLESQETALKAQLDSLNELERHNDKRLDFEIKLAEAKLKGALQDVEIAEKTGTISHEKAAERRGELKAGTEEEVFNLRQNNLRKKIDAANAGIEAGKSAGSQETRTADEAGKARQAALAKEQLDKQARDAEEKAETAYQKALGAIADQGNLTSGPKADAAHKATIEADETRSAAVALREKVGTTTEAVRKAVDDSEKAFDTATAIVAKNTAAHSEKIAAFEAHIADLQDQITENRTLYGVEKKTVTTGNNFAVQQGHEKDTKATVAAQEKAEKEREAQAKKDQPIVDESNALGARASSDLTAGLQGRANAKGQEIIKQLHDDPKNTGVMEQLVGVLNEVGSHLTSMNASQKADMDKVKAAIERLRQQINHEKGYNG